MEEENYLRLKTLLGDAEALRRVFREEPGLVNQLMLSAGFLDTLFAQPQLFKRLLTTPVARDDAGIDNLLDFVSLGTDGASSPTGRRPDTVLLARFLAAPVASEELPELVNLVVSNAAFVEQLKLFKPEICQELLNKARARFPLDKELLTLMAAVEADLPPHFSAEGGKTPSAAEKLGMHFFEAVRTGDVAAVQALLKDKVDPNLQDGEGWTALICAATYGHADVVQALLEGKADPNLRNGGGLTALMRAVARGHAPVIQALLEGKADPNLRDGMGLTALMHSTAYNRVPVIQALLEGKADPNLRDGMGLTALMHATVYGHANVVQALLDAKANPNLQNGKGWTALMLATRYNHANVVQALLEGKADANLQDIMGLTAAMLAKNNEFHEIVTLLSAAKRDWNGPAR